MFANLKQSLKHNQSQQGSATKRIVCVRTYFFFLTHAKVYKFIFDNYPLKILGTGK